MKIAMIGATGFVGSAILREALDRGHKATAIVRHPEKLPQHPNLAARKGDVRNEKETATLVAGHEAVISAYNTGKDTKDILQEYVAGYRAIINGVKQAGVKRLLVVGGAGSLYIAPNVQLVDTPDFPEGWKAGALAAREILYLLRNEPELEWTFFSPSATLEKGERTGKFRIGNDQLLTGADGKSRISVEDLAVVMVDELENPKHVRQRFTAGY